MRGLLLDTNVISEAMKTKRDARVEAWLDAHGFTSAFLSVVTIGELAHGIARLPAESDRRGALARWLHERLIPSFGARIVPFDTDASLAWGRLVAEARDRGRMPPLADAQIAATALTRGLTLVTRNVRDFEAMGVDLLNPWES